MWLLWVSGFVILIAAAYLYRRWIDRQLGLRRTSALPARFKWLSWSDEWTSWVFRTREAVSHEPLRGAAPSGGPAAGRALRLSAGPLFLIVSALIIGTLIGKITDIETLSSAAPIAAAVLCGVAGIAVSISAAVNSQIARSQVTLIAVALLVSFGAAAELVWAITEVPRIKIAITEGSADVIVARTFLLFPAVLALLGMLALAVVTVWTITVLLRGRDGEAST